MNGVAQREVKYTATVDSAYMVTFHTQNAKKNGTFTLYVDGSAVSGDYSVDTPKNQAYTGVIPTAKNNNGVASVWKTAQVKINGSNEEANKLADFDATKAVEGDMNLYPHNPVAHHTVTFDAQGGSDVKASDVANNTTVAKPADPTRAEDDNYVYEFGGWYTEAACTNAYDFNTKVTGPFTLYAKWNITGVKVSFNPNYGTEKAKVVTFKAGDKLTAPEVTREGYELAGWTSDADRTNEMPAFNAYAAAQGYPLAIHQTDYGTSAAATLYYISSNGADGVEGSDQNGLPVKFTAMWKTYVEAIKDFEGLVNVELTDAQAKKLYNLDSYKAYVEEFKGDYLASKAEAAKGGLNKDEYAALVQQLKDMQAKLVEVGDTAVYRVYNPNNGDHYFTTYPKEASALVALGWQAEGAPYKVVSAKRKAHMFGTAVYSVYNPNTGEHLLTFEGEADALAAAGWTKEGVKFYTVQNGSEDVVRVYNPNTNGPAHLYTDASEANSLAAKGWQIDNAGKPVFVLD